MVIGNRLRQLRESKELSQGEIEKRSGLLRCYISRVENGHTVPAVSTLEKMARALDVAMYRFMMTSADIIAQAKNSERRRIRKHGQRSRLPLQIAQATFQDGARRPKTLAAHGAKSRERLTRTAYGFPQAISLNKMKRICLIQC
jgi:transcriptional regulator with XRE-family HTH domain